ncbi:hypothetical protein BV22DRAFT_1133144 [Leucogyrophana mollusca]|uniref:Uncharacterized protein n=1 Tax=Leucogyrophana mollusca TaxID=85980 RepID=A0ACB8B3Z0_9AGAM|nr:hypothetical protein BV22DRAFT_1133144 [Leucogyrophana mollusca]
MASPDLTSTATPSEGVQRYSTYAKKFSISPITPDPVQWDKDWERCINSPDLEKSSVLLVAKKQGMRLEGLPAAAKEGHLTYARSAVVERQGHVHTFFTSFRAKGGFDTIWLLLEEPDRQKHILNGLQEACSHSFLGEDGRACCPELTVASMTKGRGNGFLRLLELFGATKKSAKEGVPFGLPSEWWERAVDDEAKPLSSDAEFVYELLTLGRNEFICMFILYVSRSTNHDVVNGAKSVDPIMKLMEDKGFANALAEVTQSVRETPIIRCENCEKSADELGSETRFMVCSACKKKLDFSLHYCSQACQRADWGRHKRNCGKQKVSKRLPGTAEDSTWATPSLPDFARDELNHFDAQGKDITTLGFGKSQFPRSAALQLQVSMLEADKPADYFLFTPARAAVRFVIDDPSAKMMFRFFRAEVMSSQEHMAIGPMVQYLIKGMAGSPGLSREIILKQISDEYGVDAEERLKRTEGNAPPGVTFMERIQKSVATMGPRLMNSMK